MSRQYDSLYISPHLDDVAFSCAGQIYQQTSAGQRALIITLTTADPPASPPSEFSRLLHERWQLGPETAAGRRAEDVAACQLIGADYLHWPILDCIYRLDPLTGQALYPTRDDIFGPVQPADSSLVAEVVGRLAALPPVGRVIAPLAVGHHVDHQLARTAAEQWRGSDLWYYEEYPYAQLPGALDAVIGDGQDWLAEVVPLSAEALRAKLGAFECYASQLSSFFASRADLEEQVGGYVGRVGGERLWRHRPR
jgi:LmbE family N-acetylglucosaminyl deacetylase